jgi:hypothetical protein
MDFSNADGRRSYRDHPLASPPSKHRGMIKSSRVKQLE